MNLELRKYNDSINEIIVEFHSDASQQTVTALECSGEWYEAREILRSHGYQIIENINVN